MSCGGRSGVAWCGGCGQFACEGVVPVEAPAAELVALRHGHAVRLSDLPVTVRAGAKRRGWVISLRTLCVVGGWGMVTLCCPPWCWVAISERYRMVG